jgi:hypothetical protein
VSDRRFGASGKAVQESQPRSKKFVAANIILPFHHFLPFLFGKMIEDKMMTARAIWFRAGRMNRRNGSNFSGIHLSGANAGWDLRETRAPAHQ